jgi:peptidyl-prolyl cis-trans isomerase SurA
MMLIRSLLLIMVVADGFAAAAGAASPRVLQQHGLPPAANQPGRRGAPAAPQQYPEMRIAAVVNDDVISVADLAARVRMVMLSTSIPDSPETRQRVTTQVLRSLVDEKLELQEAKRRNIAATQDEIDKAIASIAQQNNLKPDQLDQILKTNGIDRSALVDQVTASIEWVKVVRQLASEINPVSDEEIDDTLKRLKQDVNAPEMRVAEIFLPVDNPSQDGDVRAFAERLIEQMKHGARFSAIAQQFSKSATASVGGDLGWVNPAELSPVLGKAVADMRPGELSPPIRAAGGYYLMLVLDRRGAGAASENETVLNIVQVVFPLPSQAGEEARRAAMAQADKVRSEAKNCADMLRIGKTEAPQLSSQGDLRLSQISPGMRNTVLGLGIGQPSQPILQKNGVGVIMVCKKADPGKVVVPTRDDVAETLMRGRLDAMARRYLRDLRRSAFVDVRV